MNRFTQGIAIFRCDICDRRTRETHSRDAAHNHKCFECWELAGYENQLSDDGSLSPRDWADVALHRAKLTKFVGQNNVDFLFPSLSGEGDAEVSAQITAEREAWDASMSR